MFWRNIKIITICCKLAVLESELRNHVKKITDPNAQIPQGPQECFAAVRSTPPHPVCGNIRFFTNFKRAGQTYVSSFEIYHLERIR